MSTSVDLKTFLRRGNEGFNLVPISRKYLGDLETPLSVYLKLSDFPNTFLFESVVGESVLAVTRLLGCPKKNRGLGRHRHFI